MPKYLLDTNVLIEWVAQGPSQEFLLQILEDETAELSIAWISLVEFLVKASKKEQKNLLAAIHAGDLIVQELSGLEDAIKIATLRAQTSLKIPDCLVLATAMNLGAILLTRDEELFRKGKKIYKSLVRPFK